MTVESAEFKQAVEHSRQLKSKPSDDDLLEIYALYKVGTGTDFAAVEKPGMFDLKGKAKYNAWKKVVDEGLSPQDAQKRYVEKIEHLKGVHGFSG